MPFLRVLLCTGFLLELLTGNAVVGDAVARDTAAGPAEWVVSEMLHHLRSGEGGSREWTDFPEDHPGAELRLGFRARRNEQTFTLLLRQHDVKQQWTVELNGRPLGRLVRNENDMLTALAIPPGTLRDGDNVLRVFSSARRVDDIRVGDFRVLDRGADVLFHEATVSVRVTDGNSGAPLPGRITILDSRGHLAPVGARSGGQLAVRTGTVYTGDGEARFGLRAGEYTVIAGRGFEYGIARESILLESGRHERLEMKIHRQVPTPGLVSCDTHIHTVTHSGHGDATTEERVVTIAGEGIELPVATDHNKHIDLDPVARRLGVRKWFTPVIGNEVTTPVGHFNIFPCDRGRAVPEWKVKTWDEVLSNIARTPGVRVVILNHPRDVHSDFRPFGPESHISVVGENLHGWELAAPGMEMLNSAALQSDGLLLLRDWFGHLNRGRRLVPVGASDSHDVARHFVGQGRTYIVGADEDPAKIDVSAVCENLLRGRVMVSMGLLVRIRVAGSSGPGDLARVKGPVPVAVQVLGPGWTRADRVLLFANGREVRHIPVDADSGRTAGVKWSGEWTLPRFSHDVHLVAVATGPGVRSLHWRVPKSYQPSSPIWNSYVIGITGAVWLDADGDGKFQSAREYAEGVIRRAGKDRAKLVTSLADHDEAVAAQAASLLWRSGVLPTDEALARLLETRATGATRRGFARFAKQWRESMETFRPVKSR